MILEQLMNLAIARTNVRLVTASNLFCTSGRWRWGSAQGTNPKHKAPHPI